MAFAVVSAENKMPIINKGKGKRV